MANIKVSELKDLSKATDNVKTITYKGLDIEVKTYLDVVKKLELAMGIYRGCVDTRNGMLTIDKNSKEIALVNLIIEHYTNINLPKDKIHSYDLLMQTGLYDAVKSIIEDEIEAIEQMIDNIATKEYEEYQQKNSIQYILKDFLYALLELVPSAEETKVIIEELSKKIQEFDPKKMEYVNEFMKLNKGKSE